MQSRHPYSRLQEFRICDSSGYLLSACAWLESKNKVVFITKPTVLSNQSSVAHLGLFDLESRSMSSIVTNHHPKTEVTSLQVCSQGILMCCETGLSLVNFKNGDSSVLVKTKNNESGCYISGVAVHPNETIWVTVSDPDPSFSSRAICIESNRKVLIEAGSVVRHPTCIAISPDGRNCYISSSDGYIWTYRISADRRLVGGRQLSYLKVPNIRVMKCDSKGFLFACNTLELMCWDRYGQLTDRITFEDPVLDFVFTDLEFIVMHKYSWGKMKPEQYLAGSPFNVRSELQFNRMSGRFSRL